MRIFRQTETNRINNKNLCIYFTKLDNITGKVIELSSGTGSNKPPVNPEDFEIIDKQLIFEQTIKVGFLVQPENYRLAMDDKDRANWDQFRNHLLEKERLGQIDENALVTFLDITGTPRQATLARFRKIIIELGDAYQAAFFQRHS